MRGVVEVTRPWWARSETYGLYGGYDTLATLGDKPLDRVSIPGDIGMLLRTRGYITAMPQPQTPPVLMEQERQAYITALERRLIELDPTPRAEADQHHARRQTPTQPRQEPHAAPPQPVFWSEPAPVHATTPLVPDRASASDDLGFVAAGVVVHIGTIDPLRTLCRRGSSDSWWEVTEGMIDFYELSVCKTCVQMLSGHEPGLLPGHRYHPADLAPLFSKIALRGDS